MPDLQPPYNGKSVSEVSAILQKILFANKVHNVVVITTAGGHSFYRETQIRLGQVQHDGCDLMLLLTLRKYPATMNVLEQLKTLTSKQRSTVIACFLGWTLDAFDFFILVFVIKDIAKEFGTNVTAVTFTLFLTLAMRPLGAFLFGVIADRYGRRPTLMANILFYSIVEFACGFCSFAHGPDCSPCALRNRHGW
jgi:Sugar (and other) transporter